MCCWRPHSCIRHARSSSSAGHIHGGEIQVLENLRVVTGPAEYRKPQIQRVLQVIVGLRSGQGSLAAVCLETLRSRAAAQKMQRGWSGCDQPLWYSETKGATSCRRRYTNGFLTRRTRMSTGIVQDLANRKAGMPERGVTVCPVALNLEAGTIF